MGPFLGYEVHVDIFKNHESTVQLSNDHFHSSDYSVVLIPPYANDTYGFAFASHSFPEGDYRRFELIYFPDDDECLIDYYWNELTNAAVNTEDAKVSLIKLPDLRGAQFVVRMEALEEYWGRHSPLSLNFIRMRVGDHELILAGNDFSRATLSSSGQLIYTKTLPENFSSLLALFETVRYDADVKPSDGTELQP